MVRRVENERLVSLAQLLDLGHHRVEQVVDGEQARPPVAEVLVLPAVRTVAERRVLTDVLGLGGRAGVVIGRERDGDVFQRVAFGRFELRKVAVPRSGLSGIVWGILSQQAKWNRSQFASQSAGSRPGTTATHVGPNRRKRASGF